MHSTLTELAPTDLTASPRVQRFVTFFEALTPNDIAQLDQLYQPDARFVDPFNDVTGLPAIADIFRHMFVTLQGPRFVVTSQMEQGRQCFLTWEFRFRFKRFRRDTQQTIHGATHLEFGATGLVMLHRDYWDAAQELYEKLPLLGVLMRWLRRQAMR